MKALKIAAAVIAVLVIGLGIFLATFDVGKYKGLIEEQAKAATGRDVTIGTVRMALSLTPTVLVEDVTLANAPWGSRPQMVTVKKLEARAALLPLLSGHIDIGKISVSDADVLLEVNKQGVANWEFAGASKDATAPQNPSGAQSALSVGAVEVTNLKLGYKDEKGGADSEIDLKSLVAHISGPIQNLNITHVDLADLAVSHKDGATAIDASVGKVALDSTGKITDFGFKQLDVADVKVTGKTASGPIDAAVSKLSLDEKGALDLAATYNGQDLKAKGTIAAPAALKGGITAVPAKLALEGFGLKGDVDLTVEAGKTPPAIKGSVTIPELDLGKFTKGGGTDSKAAGHAAPASGRVFSDEPLPWTVLNEVDANVKVAIASLKLPGGQTVENVVLPIDLAHGRLTVKDANVAMFGGTADADVTANAADKTFATKLVVKGLTAEALAKAFKVTDLVTNGPLDINVDVHGAGASPHALASTLSGSAIAGMGESRIRNEALNFIGADMVMQVLNAVNPMGNRDPYTVSRCAVVNFQIAGGIANTQNGIALVTDKMNLVASGKLDLGQERIDMTVKPTATSGLGLGLGKLVSAIRLNGPMTKPNVGLDSAGSAKAIGSIGLAFATGGASLLAQGMKDRADTSTGDPCQTARTWQLKK
ncbi:MAG: AsmA family protein [Rhodospirillaceae bacterium]|nr:MAG: AsmA family protein [Rhodospirillaceae bacterium]